jgi:DeoR family suf operon transcriptional repressor
MTALSVFGQRQQILLGVLLQKREGLTVDALSKELKISRNAVNQHIASLENSGFIENSSLSSSGGRPSKVYSLTESGVELFPKHYALFSNLLIHWIKDKLGDKELKKCMTTMGKQVALEFKDRVDKNNKLNDKVNEVSNIMHELGYDSRVEIASKKQPEIVANNCVFHQIANESNEVCELDLSLLSTLLDAKIDHKECMVKGGACCRFSVAKKT